MGFVTLKNSEKIPANIVILGAGVIPQTNYLKSSGINLDKDGGISVDSHMSIPGSEGIYAVGMIFLIKVTLPDIHIILRARMLELSIGMLPKIRHEQPHGTSFRLKKGIIQLLFSSK